MTTLVVSKNDAGKKWDGVVSFDEVMSKYPAFSKTELPEVDIQPDDESTLLFTSGTTG